MKDGLATRVVKNEWASIHATLAYGVEPLQHTLIYSISNIKNLTQK